MIDVAAEWMCNVIDIVFNVLKLCSFFIEHTKPMELHKKLYKKNAQRFFCFFFDAQYHYYCTAWPARKINAGKKAHSKRVE